jgi:MerR family transcriptional regulator/heat shock protein HspR
VDTRDSSVSVFVISVAAQLADMHPQTLRNYEREGLINPARTAGGNRMYSEDDLARLAAIGHLTGRGLNIAGIRLVLELQAEVEALTDEVERLRNELGKGNR